MTRVHAILLAAAVAVAPPAVPEPATAADLILNEYNAVDGNRLLEDDAADPFWGVRNGNGGDWFELVVITDHLDVRGWEFVVIERAGDPFAQESFSLTLTDEGIWSDLRSGTIVTISEQLGNNAGRYRPNVGRWWLNVRAGGDASGRFVTAACIDPACDSAGVNWKVSNSDWQLTIRDAAGRLVFGPAGEGVAPASGVGATEVVKLEEDPTDAITPLSGYQDGSSSTFGLPNRFNGGLNEQDFGALRAVVPYSELTTVRINEIFSHSDPGEDWIELFNGTGAAIDIGGWFLSDSLADLTRYQIPAGTTIAAGGYLVFVETQLGFALSAACGDELVLSVGDGNMPTGPRDFAEFGAVENGVSFGRPFDGSGPVVRLARATMGATNSEARTESVVINEIMYNPGDTGPGISIDAEFVELHNGSGTAVDLFTSFGLDGTFGWRLRGGIDFTFPVGTAITQRGYLLVVPFDPVADLDALAEFRAIYGLDLSVPIVGPYSGGLNNFRDDVRLARPDTPEADGTICGGTGPGPFVPSVLLDEVSYVDFAPWPPEADGTGASLERVSTTSSGNDPANWVSDPVAGPTPGRRNSGAPTTTLPPPQCAIDADCDDANPCTADVCDGFFQCANPFVDVGCDDGLACTTDDACSSGVCVGSPPCSPDCNRCEGLQCLSLCGVPASRSATPVASDALLVLRASVGIETCATCICDVDSSGAVTSSDALRVLIAAAGFDTQLFCLTTG